MLSRLVRRTHMYLALSLFPWMLMYALSTLVMNHRAMFTARFGEGPPPFDREREVPYRGSFADPGNPRAVAREILASLRLEGAYTVAKGRDGALVINRNDLIAPRRLTYSPAAQTVTVERMRYRANAFLERFHRRRGYATGYALDTAWAVTVDLVIVAMLVWVLSGLWMWWEMKVTRRLGALALVGGTGLFLMYLATI
ncbi:MAG TPA: PepSY-associated TM helix domain-containing protein [Vicinamibacterales bacterium]|nr:PepSY-associated TM helix domain-containing protein [Vicinamibacterales bacterium]